MNVWTGLGNLREDTHATGSKPSRPSASEQACPAQVAKLATCALHRHIAKTGSRHHLWKRALCRACATSSAQYLNNTSRSLSAWAARCSKGSTSGASMSPSLRHSPCTHLHMQQHPRLLDLLPVHAVRSLPKLPGRVASIKAPPACPPGWPSRLKWGCVVAQRACCCPGFQPGLIIPGQSECAA